MHCQPYARILAVEFCGWKVKTDITAPVMVHSLIVRESISQGPAPRPLPRLGMSKDRDGKILVDKAEEVSREFRLIG